MPQVKGEWTHTVQGQPVIDNVPLKHECNGASDFCMHCSVDMCGSDPRATEPCVGLERARRLQIKPETVIAFGCDKEAQHGDEPCKQWCGGLNCTYTRAPASSTDSLPSMEVLPGIAPGQVNKKESHDQ